MDLLSGSESDGADKNQNSFKINKKYARSYETWRRKEEKQKLIDKYGDDLDSSSEEEEEIRSTQKLDKEWLRAYAVVRFQQPRLYSGEKLFNEEVKPVVKKTEKKVTLKDHERKFILEKGGIASEDDDEENEMHNVGQTYFEEQEELKSSFKQAVGNVDESDDEEDGLLVKKAKTEQEKKEEENEYLAWLKGEKEDLGDKDATDELAPLKAYWSDPNLTDKEKVLRDYILNNGYMNKEGSDDDESDDDGAFEFSEEEEFLDKADSYEQKYNFRHEEPGGIEIKTYPRVIETSVRAKEENRRVEKRRRKMEKLQREKEKRTEEIKILQRLQREEKEEKLQKLKETSDNPNMDYNLDADFDPDEHDELMKKYFDDGYYGDEDPGKKPVFDPDEEGVESKAYEDAADEWWQQRKQAQADVDEGDEEDHEELYADDPGFVMDADYDPNNVDESSKKTKKSKKDIKKEKKKKKLEKAPLFDPTTKTFDEYLDEYLKDKINTLPFTYREVVSNDFGLSTDEILTAQDRELNSWVSVKKMSAYRSEQEEKGDIHKYKMKAMNQHKKHKVMPSLAPQQSKEPSEIKMKKKKKKKKTKAEKEETNVEEALPEEEVKQPSDPSSKKESKAKKRKRESESGESMQTDSVQDSTPNPKIKSKKKKRKLDDGSDDVKPDDDDGNIETDVTQKKDKRLSKKAKKRKTDLNNEEIKIPAKESSQSKDVALKTNSSEETTEAVEISKKPKKKKNKKKKSKLYMNVSDTAEHQPAAMESHKLKGTLKKVMSSSRMSSYGLGPGANKHAGATHKKKKKKVVSKD